MFEREDKRRLGTNKVRKNIADQDRDFGRGVEIAEVKLRRKEQAHERTVDNAQSLSGRSGQRLGEDDEREKEQRRIEDDILNRRDEIASKQTKDQDRRGRSAEET